MLPPTEDPKMGKVLKQNVILGGRELKAGTKEGDIPKDIKEPAARFLIDEKKYKPAGQPKESIDGKAKARISELETQLENETSRANEAEVKVDESVTALSEANSNVAGLETQLENKKPPAK
jgi:hypothetical protein